MAEWLERCASISIIAGSNPSASISMIAGSNPSGGSDLTFRSDLLLTARGSST
jgi:hypothetical protein